MVVIFVVVVVVVVIDELSETVETLGSSQAAPHVDQLAGVVDASLERGARRGVQRAQLFQFDSKLVVVTVVVVELGESEAVVEQRVAAPLHASQLELDGGQRVGVLQRRRRRRAIGGRDLLDGATCDLEATLTQLPFCACCC